MAKSKRSSKFGGHNEEAQKAAQQQAAESIGGNIGPRVKVKDGRNVLWVLPRVGQMPAFYQRMLVHYAPFHLCGRVPKTPNPTNPKEMLEDRNFKHCYRCLEAWNAYDAAGKPGAKNRDLQPPEKKKFKADMPNDQVAFQVVDLTPFFKQGSGDLTVDEAEAANLAEFFKIALGGEPGEDVSAEVTNAALAGVDVLTVSESLGKDIIAAEVSCRKEQTKLAKKLKDAASKKEAQQIANEGPCMNPERFLLVIDREDDKDRDFDDGKGGTRYAKQYGIEFVDLEDVDGWTTPDSIWELAEAQCQDLTDIVVEDDAVEAQARGFVKLTDEQMRQYLDESNHSFTVSNTRSESSDPEVDMSDPDSFGDSDDDEDSALANADARSRLQAARNRVRDEADGE